MLNLQLVVLSQVFPAGHVMIPTDPLPIKIFSVIAAASMRQHEIC